MALPEFDLHIPGSLDEALSLTGRKADPTLLMAGGTDVMVQLKQGLLAPHDVVSLAKVAELRYIRESSGVFHIGGGTTVAALEASGPLLQKLPGLVDAARTMATIQIRQRATVAGNLVTAAACADLSPILVALGAKVWLQSAGGKRAVPLSEFFVGPRVTVLAPGEILVAVEVEEDGPGRGSAYVKFGYRRGAQIAVASAAARVALDGAKVAAVSLVLGAVAPVPLRVQGTGALLGQSVEGAPLQAVCAAASAECRPISDLRGSEAFRRAVVAVVTRQALERAAARARGGRP